VLFYLRGDAQILNMPSLSIVGTRRPTLYGSQMAERLGRDLAARGLVVVSGMARWLRMGGRLECWGPGWTSVIQRRIKNFMRRFWSAGAILSEFLLGTHPAPENFPIRNRIVAGMPLGVVVIEGAEFSGSLITARLAMEFGREVFGVPGNVTQAVSYAPNLLIKQGAKLVVNAEDVIEEFADTGSRRTGASGETRVGESGSLGKKVI
jgi:DNA processing protein